jgi:phosphoglycolate phosphatase-like HAD superfamily hydrolase
MAVSTVLFDIDGTLALLPIDWGGILRLVQVESCSANSFLGFVYKCHGTESFLRVHRVLRELELRAVSSLAILDDSPNLVKKLCKRYSLGFVTMQCREAADALLNKLGLSSCAKVVLARESARNRVEQVAKAMKTLGVEPSEVLFIGDKVLDGFAAYVNGAKAVVVLRGGTCDRVSDTDYITEDLEALGIPVVKSLGEALELSAKLGWIEPP